MKTYDIQTTTRTTQPTAVANTTLTVEEIASWLGKAYSAVAATLAKQGTYPAGPPFARYHKLSNGHFEVEAGFPLMAPIKADGEVRPSSLPGGKAATFSSGWKGGDDYAHRFVRRNGVGIRGARHVGSKNAAIRLLATLGRST